MTKTTQEQQTAKRQRIEETIAGMFAPEDAVLHSALQAAKEHGLPEIQISPIQGKLLQLFAKACQAQKILEIGSLAGYSGIWLARALPANGHLITLEIDPVHAEIVRQSFKQAGVAEKTEVLVGPALQRLPEIVERGPFDLIFIDADKASYPQYLEWAIKLSRSGSIIIADNCVRSLPTLWEKDTAGQQNDIDANTQGLLTYNQRTKDDPRLTALLLANDEDYTDGFNVAIVSADA